MAGIADHQNSIHYHT